MHIYNFIKNTLANRDFEIYIISHSIIEIPAEYKLYYHKNHITVYSPRNISGFNGRDVMTAIRKFLYKIKIIRSIGYFDVCHIHYLNIYSCILYLLNKKRFGRLILTFWGSDILVENKRAYWFRKRCMKYADQITASVYKTLRTFHDKYGHDFDDKVRIVRFMSGTIDIIKDKLLHSVQSESKQRLGFPLDKITITLGYNADSAQHQDLLIQYLDSLPDSIKDKLFVVVPMTYSRINNNYIENVEKSLQSSSMKGKILTDYMNYDQMADLSIASDIYVNARDTDAFSNSMKEQLFAGTLMIQGKWLEYDELDAIAWPRVIINDRSELPIVVRDIIGNHPDKIKKNSCRFIWETFSGPGVRKQWDELYRELGIWQG